MSFCGELSDRAEWLSMREPRGGEVLAEGRTLEDEVRLIGEGKVKTV